jgi:hypothetical protein
LTKRYGAASPRGKKLTRPESAQFRENKATVLGMVERDGRVRARVIQSRRGEALSSAVRANVNRFSVIYTDDWLRTTRSHASS